MRITKSDFLEYLSCGKSFWLKKNKPELSKEEVLTDYEQMIIKAGYEVEGYAQQLFPEGVDIEKLTPEQTKEELQKENNIFFQASFQTKEGLFVRVDVLEKNNDGTFNIYEIKSKLEPKLTGPKNHLDDITFQKVVLEKEGLKIKNSYIITLNKKYTRDVDLNIQELFLVNDITKKVEEKYEEIKIKAQIAVALAKEKEIDESCCPCIQNTKGSHCVNFEYFNDKLEKDSIWYLTGIRQKRLQELLANKCRKLTDIKGELFEALNDKQKLQVQAATEGEPIIQRENVKKTLSSLKYPLYFLDYETSAFAIPRLVGTHPWEHLLFQFSLHKLNEDGTLEHYEFINETLSNTDELLKKLSESIGDVGSVIVWHKSFEMARNKDQAKNNYLYEEFLDDVNDRIFDLKEIFVSDYIHPDFFGSASIKKVLPIMCEGFTYENLDVSDGTQAVDAWIKLIDEKDQKEKEKLKRSLLEYCKLDTLAMVEIYKVIKDIK